MKNDIEKAPLQELYAEADRLRRETFGEDVELCSIVNIKSGRCSMDCRFCAQSGFYETKTPFYPLLDAEELRSRTESAWESGVHRVGWVASGCAIGKDDLKKIAESARKIEQKKDLCASLGQLDKTSLKTLKESGFTRYHHNLETSQKFYPNICTTQRWTDRFETVGRAKETGFEVCSGGLFGLGESWDDRIELALALQKLEVDSVPINFFNPIPGTPFENIKPLSAEEGLRIIVLFRIMLPKTSIRICGGRPTTLGSRQSELFSAGADALMTGNYLTTPGFSLENDLELISHKRAGDAGGTPP